MVYRVAIVGAGPAGCLLARLLMHLKQHNAFEIVIFESEADIDFRSQGGTLDLHESTGQLALKRAGLFEEFQKHVRYDGEALKLADKHMLCYVKTGGGSKKSSLTGRPEIDRPVLRQMLYNSLPEGIVQWNKKLLSIDDDRILHFADGSVRGGFDLVVGADGAWSKVRPVVSDAQPYYSGIAGHAMSIPNAEQDAPELYEMVNRGSLFTFSDGKSVMAQYMGDGSLYVGTWAVRSSDWQEKSGCDMKDATATKEFLRKDYEGWDSRLIAITQQVEDHVVPRELFMLPVGHHWEHKPGFTLIGDASHLMTPFAGEGVNLAFEDALKLSEVLLTVASSKKPTVEAFDKAVANFEQDMFVRAKKVQQTTYDMMTAMYFTPGAPRKGIERYVIRAIGGEMSRFVVLLLTPMIYSWFFMFKLFHKTTTE